MSLSNAELKAAVDRRFVLSGERARLLFSLLYIHDSLIWRLIINFENRLLEFIKLRLAETGWNDALYAHCFGMYQFI